MKGLEGTWVDRAVDSRARAIFAIGRHDACLVGIGAGRVLFKKKNYHCGPAVPDQEERLWVAHITEDLVSVKHAGD